MRYLKSESDRCRFERGLWTSCAELFFPLTELLRDPHKEGEPCNRDRAVRIISQTATLLQRLDLVKIQAHTPKFTQREVIPGRLQDYFWEQSESCMHVFVCSRPEVEEKDAAKGKRNHWQWHISSATKKRKKEKRESLKLWCSYLSSHLCLNDFWLCCCFFWG